MREIEVDTFLKPMGTGISRPVLVLGDDFEEYILKNEKVDDNGKIVNYNCMFVNELLSYQIGCFLELPMPEAVVAIVDGEFAEDDPNIRFAYRFEKGKYFATERLKYVENNIINNYNELAMMGKPYILSAWKKFFKNIDNKEDIAKILAFDILIANFDRYNNEGNILINKNGGRKIYAIDHGHAFFGPCWNETKINCLNLIDVTNTYIDKYSNIVISQLPGVVFNSLEESINLENMEDHSFKDIVMKIIDIDENMIESWMNNIPNEWYIDKVVQVSYYKKFILKQKEIVKDIIQNLAIKKIFTRYEGGILKWTNQEENSHTV